VRAGDRSKLPASLDAFAEAARLRPWDRSLLAQWSWALLDAGQPGRARATAERALTGSAAEAWLAWAVIARAARELGDGESAERAAVAARRLVPAPARPVLEFILSG
jgi:Flp pilus assembly protein TadD